MSDIRCIILLAGDDTGFYELLKNHAEQNAFKIQWVSNGMEVIKDSGFNPVNTRKQLEQTMPQVFITTKSVNESAFTLPEDKESDYAARQFDSDFILKINSLLHGADISTREKKSDTFTLGKYILDATRQILNGPYGMYKLTSRESELLKLLCQYKNHLLSREVALKTIWGTVTHFNSRSMDVFISKIRKYLKEDPSLELINIRGKGFKLITSVR